MSADFQLIKYKLPFRRQALVVVSAVLVTAFALNTNVNSAFSQSDFHPLDMDLNRIHYYPGDTNMRYYYGDNIIISGFLDDGDEQDTYRYAGLYVSLQHYNENNVLIKSGLAKVLSNGSYLHSFEAKKTADYKGDGFQRITGKFQEGNRTLRAEVTFRVLPVPVEKPTFIELPKKLAELVVDDVAYKMLYQTPRNLSLGTEHQIGAIKVNFDNGTDRFAILELPRNLIDSTSKGKDSDFVVFSGNGRTMPFVELDSKPYARTILLNYTDGKDPEINQFFITGTEIAGRDVSLPNIMLKFDKVHYEPDEHAILSGSVSVRGNPLPISLEIIDSGNKTLLSRVILSDYFGNFSTTVRLEGALGAEGKYAIKVEHLGRIEGLEYSVLTLKEPDLPTSLFVSKPLAISSTDSGSHIRVGDSIQLTVNIGRNQTQNDNDVQFLVILELRDKIAGTTQFISEVLGTIHSIDTDLKLRVGWTADYVGTFELRAFTIIEDDTITSISNVASSEMQVYA